MNRSEYLMALYDALNDIPSEIRTEAIREYQEYFRSEIEKGRTEEEIALSLGDPITLAYAIKQRRGYGHPQKSYSKAYSQKRRRLISPRIMAGVITVLVGIFIILGIGTNAFSTGEFKMSGFNFGIGKRYDINDYKEVNLGSAKTIIIRTLSTNANIRVVASDKVTGLLKGSVRTSNEDCVPTLGITVAGETITIEEKRKSNNIIGFYSSSLDLEITIPKNFHGNIEYRSTSGDFNTADLEIDNLTLSLTSGDVVLDGIVLKNSLQVKSTSGNIEIMKLKAKNVAIGSTSGDNKLMDFSVDEQIDINTTSGDNKLENIKCEKLLIDSTSGKVEIHNGMLGHMNIECLSGNIDIEDIEGGANLKTTSGNISARFSRVTGEIDLSASSGNIKLYMPSKTEFTLNSQATSGNIYCDFKLDNENSGKNSLKGRHGNGDIPIKINTTSGNIVIKN